MDQCTHCTMRGNLNGCLATKCNQHESWMIGELKYVMASLVRRCEDELADPEDVVELLEARAVLTPNAHLSGGILSAQSDCSQEAGNA